MTRDWCLNFDEVEIAPGAERIVSTSTEIPFRGEKLVAFGDLAGVLLRGFSVGDKKQMPGGDVPLVAFTTDAVGNGLTLDPCAPNSPFAVHLLNASDAPKRVTLILLGKGAV